MKYLTVVFALMVIGCHHSLYEDRTPPAPPQGIRALALDNSVQLTWLASPEPDVAGYRVWYSDRYDGRYRILGSVGRTSFTDYDAKNGTKTYYGVSAYDYDGNESDLSTDLVYATPRPEGFGTKLSDYHVAPLAAGYDFSSYTVGDYRDTSTDVYFDAASGRFFFDVWNDTDIQDMGYTSSLDDIVSAPSAGWSPSRSVEAIVGHTYVVWTWDDHYAKLRVKDVSSSRVTFDWAYQLVASNPQLKHTATIDGSGMLHREAGSMIMR
ncbi:MAG TPA: hypothetical protein VMH23_19975 [Bacteroidota bacterium]|nr:hypothetical protein [Bacteroidota bacterium]